MSENHPPAEPANRDDLRRMTPDQVRKVDPAKVNAALQVAGPSEEGKR